MCNDYVYELGVYVRTFDWVVCCGTHASSSCETSYVQYCYCTTQGSTVLVRCNLNIKAHPNLTNGSGIVCNSKASIEQQKKKRVVKVSVCLFV